jgi:hypothetical protein
MKESQWDKAFKAISEMESLFNKAARHSTTLEDKLGFQRAAKVYSEALRQHRLHIHDAEDAVKVAAGVQHCESCGNEL